MSGKVYIVSRVLETIEGTQISFILKVFTLKEAAQRYCGEQEALFREDARVGAIRTLNLASVYHVLGEFDANE